VLEKSYNIYRRERTDDRRRRWPYVIVAAVCVFAALVGWQVLGVPRVAAVTPGPDAYVKDQALTVILDVRGLQKLSGVRVTFDGRDITDKAARSGDKLTFVTGKLADGPHSVAFVATSSNLFRHEVRKDWRFTVDTSIPTLKLDGSADEGRINTSPASFSGSTEPFSTVTVTSGSVRASGQADASGKYTVSAKLPDGPSTVQITTTDRAGNMTFKQIGVYVDAVPPTLAVTPIDKVEHSSRIKIHLQASDQLETPKVKVVLDGATKHPKGPVSDAVVSAKNLAQGTHKLVITVTDKGGNVVTSKQTWLVDSTEHFGSAAMWPGAEGKDVKQLQKRLAGAGVYSGLKSGVYDKETEAAVKKFQAKYGLAVDGRVGTNMLTALSGQIIVDIGSLRLYLYSDGHLVKSYPVATGQPAWPTPTGSYSIVNMQKDPTWLPPNSDWAKNATPIPPGTANPLGTRWMGTSAPGVGIHGVPPSEDSSIGTYASHGCIRMHNWDAVDLFSRVTVGMPVIIRQ
jgi:lipoprotein-anchoring transpeptidase ErfK/SrfK